jgi:hypothetical protein
MEGTCRVKATGSRPKIIVSADGRGVVGHAGARLLADIAEVTGLTAACGDALAGLRQRPGVHDPGRVATDLAVAARADRNHPLLPSNGTDLLNVRAFRAPPMQISAIVTRVPVPPSNE